MIKADFRNLVFEGKTEIIEHFYKQLKLDFCNESDFKENRDITFEKLAEVYGLNSDILGYCSKFPRMFNSDSGISIDIKLKIQSRQYFEPRITFLEQDSEALESAYRNLSKKYPELLNNPDFFVTLDIKHSNQGISFSSRLIEMKVIESTEVIKIPEGIEFINENCNGLSEIKNVVEFPSTLINFSFDAFKPFSRITEMKFSEGTIALFGKTCLPDLKKIVLPESIHRIDPYILAYPELLDKVILPFNKFIEKVEYKNVFKFSNFPTSNYIVSGFNYINTKTGKTILTFNSEFDFIGKHLSDDKEAAISSFVKKLITENPDYIKTDINRYHLFPKQYKVDQISDICFQQETGCIIEDPKTKRIVFERIIKEDKAETLSQEEKKGIMKATIDSYNLDSKDYSPYDIEMLKSLLDGKSFAYFGDDFDDLF